MVFSVQESVHNQFNVIILLEENSESGNLSLTERLKAGCLWILGEGLASFFSDTPQARKRVCGWECYKSGHNSFAFPTGL